MSDEELVLCAQSGNADALDELVRRWYPAIYAFCCRRMQNDAAGADLAQDTFVKLVAALPRYKAKGSFKSWLFTIAAHACTDAHRRARPAADLDELAELLPDTAPGFAARLEAGEAVKSALAALPDNQREVIVLRYYHDFEIDQIARITNTLAPTVKTRIWRGLRKMQQLLGEEWRP